MLFLPPGTARMVRLHGPLVTEDEVQAIVRHWKEQAAPDYETAFLAPPAGEEEEGDSEEVERGLDDPAYEEALRLVFEMGKASTSTLQRRLRLGYGRAARILDAMEREGIIGPPDGSRAREILRRPDRMAEVEHR
jgi:S-DNA-T family DNA segregation ATPase FtsK/SpoIIIE